MKKIKLLIFILFTLCSFQVLAQNMKFKNIKIEGLKRTNPEVIRREFILSSGKSFTKESIEEALRRIRNMNLFTNISHEISNNELIIRIEERWTTIPVLKFAAGGGVTQTTIGLYDPNTLGEYLEFGGQYQRLGETNSGVLWFKNPRLFGKRQGLDIQAWKTARLRTKYDQEKDDPIEKAGFLHLRDRLYLGYYKEINPKFRLDGIYEYHQDDFSDRIVPNNIKNTEINDLPSSTRFHFFGGKITLGQINFDRHLVDGLQLTFLGQYAISELNSAKNFFATEWKAEYFKTINKNHTFAQRFMLGATNTETIQYWFYLGGLDRIRGFADNRFAGKFFWLSNTEYRYAFWKNSWLTLQSVAFLDLIDSQEQFNYLTELRAASAGIGLRFFFPKVYRFVARLDYAKPLLKEDDNAISFGVQQFF